MNEENELARLEGFVSTLLERYNGLQTENQELQERLQAREETIETLQDDLASMKDERGNISSRVTSLIGKIEEWESANDAGGDSSESSENSTESGVQGNLFTVESQG